MFLCKLHRYKNTYILFLYTKKHELEYRFPLVTYIFYHIKTKLSKTLVFDSEIPCNI